MAEVFGTSYDYLCGNSNDPASDKMTISRNDEPEIFDIINLIKNTDEKNRSRLLAYARALCQKQEKPDV